MPSIFCVVCLFFYLLAFPLSNTEHVQMTLGHKAAKPKPNISLEEKIKKIKIKQGLTVCLL